MATNNLAVKILINAKDQASSVIDSVANKWTAFGAALASFAGAKFLGGAIDEAATFEEALDKIQARTGATAEEMGRLRDAAMEAGSTTSFTATEAAQGLEILGAAGLNAADSIATLPSVLALAKGEGIELANAAGLITDAVSIMGLSYEDSARATDVMVSAANLANTTATQLGEALKYAGGEARGAGMSLEETAAVLDALAQSGIRGEQAGTMLRNILGQLGDPASKARQELAELGITTGDLGAAIDGIAAAGPRGADAMRAFGVEAGPGVRALVSEGSAGIREYTAKLNAASGAAQQSASVMGGNLNGALAALGSAWDSLRIQLVEPLLEPVRLQVEAFAKSLANFTKTSQFESMKSALVSGFKAITAQIQAFLNAVDWGALAQRVSASLSSMDTTLKAWAANAQKTTAAVGVAFSSVSTGIATIEAAFYGLAGAGSLAFEKLLDGLSALVESQSKITFGPLKAALEATAKEISHIADSFGAAADANFGRAETAMARVEARAETLRAQWQRLNEQSAQTAFGVSALAEAQEQATPSPELIAAQEAQTAALGLYNSALAEAQSGNADAGLSLVALGQDVAEAQARVDQLAAAASSGGTDLRALGTEAQAAASDTELAATRQQAAMDETSASITAMRAEYKRLIEAGDAQGAAEALQAIEALKQGATDGAVATETAAARVASAFSAMGIDSQAALDQAADNARQNFETISGAANATAEDTRRAFEAYARTALKASADSSEAKQAEVDAMLQAQAAALGLLDVYQQLNGTAAESAQKANQSIASKQAEAAALQALKEASEDAAEKTEELGASTEQTGGIAAWMAAVINSTMDDLRQYSAAAADAVQAILDSVDSWNNKIATIRQLDTSSLFDTSATAEAQREMAALGAAAESARSEINALDKAQRGAFNYLGPFWGGIQAIKEVELAAIEAERRMLGMEIAAAELGDALGDLQRQLDDGGISTSEFVDAAERLEFQFQRLDDEDLEGLRDAIRAAKEEMADFTESAQAGLRDLQAEWAELNGQQLEALLLEQEAQRLEIEMALAEAKRDGNTEAIRALEDQLDMLERIQAVERERAAEAEAQAAIEAAEAEAEEAARRAALSDAERAHEDSIAALEARLLEAVRAQDQALEDALAAQIAAERQRHEETLANLEAESAARASTDAASTAGTTSGAAGATGTASASRAIDVRLSVNGASGGTVSVADAASADTLEAFLASLETAAAVAA
ncbi:tail protein [Marichromatium purpuratum 984]|uniref:Tail protein n=1 Tax=Marichromatium purpuratum 984 TaxID=765910 RepID=W0E3G4_MARPU|nr:phage tail tape measure protein [Marichromatium purpuratum]AHF04073.1 tail protein [Marichromatium purpuratum 984]